MYSFSSFGKILFQVLLGNGHCLSPGEGGQRILVMNNKGNQCINCGQPFVYSFSSFGKILFQVLLGNGHCLSPGEGGQRILVMSRLNLPNLPIGSFIFLLSPSHPASVAVNWQAIFYGPPSLAPTDPLPLPLENHVIPPNCHPPRGN